MTQDALKAELRRAARARQRSAAAIDGAAGDRLRDRFLAALGDALGAVPRPAVALYWPIGAELDTMPLIEALRERGHVCALPVVAQRAARLIFRVWRRGAPLVAAGHGTRAPPADAPTIVPDIVVTPLLAFDRRGYRLGRGGGYYDRTLAALRAAGPVLAVGVGFDQQEVTAVPRDDHDQRLDHVITPRRALRYTGPR